MDNNANRILLGVAALLTVVLLALVISSGSTGGGGGGSAAPQQTEQVSTDSEPIASEEPASTSAADNSSSDYDPSAEKQMTLEELEQEIASSVPPVGDNARDAATSTQVKTTKETYQDANGRGFGGLDIIVDFGLDGSYADPHVVDAASADKYPSYKMLYTSPTGVIWTIYVNDGAYMAIPLGGSGQQLTKEIILTERDVVTQYDGTRNQYSDFPLSSLTDEVGVRVTRVDAQTLDGYTVSALAAM